MGSPPVFYPSTIIFVVIFLQNTAINVYHTGLRLYIHEFCDDVRTYVPSCGLREITMSSTYFAVNLLEASINIGAVVVFILRCRHDCESMDCKSAQGGEIKAWRTEHIFLFLRLIKLARCV